MRVVALMVVIVRERFSKQPISAGSYTFGSRNWVTTSNAGKWVGMKGTPTCPTYLRSTWISCGGNKRRKHVGFIYRERTGKQAAFVRWCSQWKEKNVCTRNCLYNSIRVLVVWWLWHCCWEEQKLRIMK